MSVIATKFTRLVGVAHPLVLAPMAGSAGGKLAAAVQRAGGLGFVGGGFSSVEEIDKLFNDAEGERVSIGLLSFVLAEKPQLLSAALAHKPPVVWLSFGDPAPYVKEIKSAGALVACQVGTVSEGRQALEAGADILVAQGAEAGGHSWNARSLFPLVPAMVDMVAGRVPVLAAGGVCDGRGLAAALSLGADGVVMGTRFCASNESIWPIKTKQRLVEGNGDDTVYTHVFDWVKSKPWPEVWGCRYLKNEFSDLWAGDEEGLKKVLEDERKVYAERYKQQDVNVMDVHSGEGVDMIRCIQPAGEIVVEVMKEAVDVLQRSHQLLVAPGQSQP